MSLIGDVFEFRVLRSQSMLLRLPLGDRERQRLRLLEDRFVLDPVSQAESDGRRRFTRFPVQLTASIEVNGKGWVPVEARSLSGGGLAVSPAPQLERGEITSIRVGEPGRGIVYEMPVQAVWVERGPTSSAIGLTFIGIPRVRIAAGSVEIRVASDPSGQLRLVAMTELDKHEDAQLPVPCLHPRRRSAGDAPS